MLTHLPTRAVQIDARRMSKRTIPKGAPLAPPLRAKLQNLVQRVGESRAIAQLDLPRSTLARALAGLGLRDGTRLLIEVRLGQPAQTEVA